MTQRLTRSPHQKRDASTDRPDLPVATVDFAASGRAVATAVFVDVARVFADFDEEKKGWLAMQDVQAATLALCGFWPTASHVLDFFAQGPTAREEHAPATATEQQMDKAAGFKRVDGATVAAEELGERVEAERAVPLPAEWTLQKGEYFRVKSPEMLQHWLLEASKVAEKRTPNNERSRGTQTSPPPVLSRAQSATSKAEDGFGSAALGGWTGSSECGAFTWEEMFDALDVNGDGFLDFGDLVAAAASPGSTFRRFTLETLTRCFVEMCAAAAENRENRQPKFQASRRQFLRFMKASPYSSSSVAPSDRR